MNDKIVARVYKGSVCWIQIIIEGEYIASDDELARLCGVDIQTYFKIFEEFNGFMATNGDLLFNNKSDCEKAAEHLKDLIISNYIMYVLEKSTIL